MTPPKHDATAMRSIAPKPRARRALWAPSTIVVSLAVAVGFATVLPAQSSPTDAAKEPATPVVPAAPNRSEAVPAPESAAPKLYGLVKPEDGTVLPLPPGATYPELLEWLAARRGNGYGINSVSISGRVTPGARLELDAEVVVMVRRPEAVRVVLGFTEAILVDVEHTGAGDASYEPYSETSGHAWSLQGRGEHRLSLKLLVPLTAQTDSTKLTLTTPTDAATTTVDLVVPAESEVSAEAGVIRSTLDTEGGTAIEWLGTGGRITLVWRPRPISADPADLASFSTILPTVSGKTVQLRMIQRVTAAKGRIATLRIGIPDGFSIVDVTGRLVRSFAEESLGADRFVVIHLSEPTDGTVEVEIRVAAPLPADGRIEVSGFELPGTPHDAQTGEIAIESSTAYAMDVVDRTPGVVPMERIEMGPLSDSKAFEFSAQPFGIDLLIKPVPPVLNVAPEVGIQIATDRLDLDAKFAVVVEKGESRELRIAWPVMGWNIPPIRSGLIQEFRRGEGSSPPIDLSVPGTSSSFTIPLRANRPYDGEKLEILLPKVESTGSSTTIRPKETVIYLRYPNHVRIELDESNGLRPLSDPARSASLPEPNANEQMDVWVAPAGLKSVSLQVRRLSREIDVTGTIAVRPRGDHLIVDERLDYDVQFDTISELLVRVPREIRDQGVRFLDGSGRTLTPDVVTAEGEMIDLRLPLDRAVAGPFSISARYEVRQPAPEGATTNIPVPLVLPADADLRAAELQLSPLPHHLAIVAGGDWVRLQSTENVGRERWTATEIGDSLSLRLRPRPAGTARTQTIANALIRTVLDREGGARSVADYHFEPSRELLAMHFPAGIEPDWFRWRGRVILPEIIEQQNGRLAEIALESGQGPAVLSVGYRHNGRNPVGIASANRFDAPAFGSDVQIESTLWRVTLPESHHLFSMPDGYQAGFRWGLHHGLWSRQINERFQRVGEWLEAEPAQIGPEFENGHQYAFSRAGATQPLIVTSVSRSLVVLIGAGAAIVLGYAFASGLIPRRRRTLIAVGSILLVLWAIFPNQVQIFLQPALFGLALVGAASLAEWLLRKHLEQKSSQSAVEFVTILPGDGSTSAPPASIGSEDPTVLRAGRPEPASTSGQGNEH